MNPHRKPQPEIPVMAQRPSDPIITAEIVTAVLVAAHGNRCYEVAERAAETHKMLGNHALLGLFTHTVNYPRP